MPTLGNNPMDAAVRAVTRVEWAIEAAIRRVETPGGPPLLAEAMRYAVFPGGQRIRPRLCLAAAYACGDDDPDAADAAAAAIELLHCASLVHDDMPCFDDADLRRGKTAVHKAFGEPLALLAGDGLIVLAFEVLACGVAARPSRLVPLVKIVSRAVGAPSGIVAGQAWESEPAVDVSAYHRAKTGALFAAASMAGAAAAGAADPDDWYQVGASLGEAYQVADDIRDVAANPHEIGKPIGRDAALGRPSAARELGLAGAVARLKGLVERAVSAVPACPRQDELRALIRLQAKAFLPRELEKLAA